MEGDVIMYIVTDENNLIINYGEVLEMSSEGYPWLVNENVSFVTEHIQIHNTKLSMPKDLLPVKYCYSEEKGFYLNENYREPTIYDRINPEDVALIKADYTAELIEEGVI